MLRITSRKSLIAAMLVAAAIAVAPVSAQTVREDADDASRDQSDLGKMFNKLGRGATNLLFGWIELPKNIAAEWRRTEPFTGTIVGTVKGLGWTVARTVAGVYEVASFPFPVPRGYEPVMYPEFVMPTVWGDRLPMYRDEYMAGQANTDAAVGYGRATGTTLSNPTRQGSNDTMTTRSY